ncbi:hypothetical protein F4808DRAFT_426980 [Astrocystis sublimbata]|nr:hypothetical protein F4808DRAFT_426980 [Astrocystis sublimbata]
MVLRRGPNVCTCMYAALAACLVDYCRTTASTTAMHHACLRYCRDSNQGSGKVKGGPVSPVEASFPSLLLVCAVLVLVNKALLLLTRTINYSQWLNPKCSLLADD